MRDVPLNASSSLTTNVHGGSKCVLQAAQSQFLPITRVRHGFIAHVDTVRYFRDDSLRVSRLLDGRIRGTCRQVHFLPRRSVPVPDVVQAYFFFLSAAALCFRIVQPVMMVSILFFVMLGGLLLRKTDIPDSFILFYWIDSVAWSIHSLSINQYLAPKFGVCVYGGIDYCTRFGTTFGKNCLKLSGMPTEAVWIYLEWLYFFVGYRVLVFAAHLALEYQRFECSESTTVVQANLDAKAGPPDAKTNINKVAPALQAHVAVPMMIPRTSAPRVTLAFHELWYSVLMPGGKNGEDIDLLQGVSGYAKPGAMTALMGLSLARRR